MLHKNLEMAGQAVRILPRFLGCTRTHLGFRLQSDSACQAENDSPKYPGIVESTDEYRFVEMLIPPTRIPSPPKHEGTTPSGWIPPRDSPPDLPYFIRRSRMHNIPVYTDITRVTRKLTVIRRIEGDIWALEQDVKEYLTQILGKTPLTQVHEIARSIRVKGFYDQELKSWLAEKGF